MLQEVKRSREGVLIVSKRHGTYLQPDDYETRRRTFRSRARCQAIPYGFGVYGSIRCVISSVWIHLYFEYDPVCTLMVRTVLFWVSFAIFLSSCSRSVESTCRLGDAASSSDDFILSLPVLMRAAQAVLVENE